MFAKIGPLTKRNSRLPETFVEHRGAGDVGRHQVGRELDALELHIENLADRADHQRFRQAGHADEQAMAAREDGGEDLLDDFGLADDGAAKLVDDLLACLAELGQIFADFVVGHRHTSSVAGFDHRPAVRLTVLPTPTQSTRYGDIVRKNGRRAN